MGEAEPPSMKVVIASTNVGGGAGVAAQRLHIGLRKLGHESTLLTRDTEDQELRIEKLPSTLLKRAASIFAKLQKRTGLGVPYSWDRVKRLKFLATCELFSDFRSESGKYDYKLLPDCDIVNLHWVPYFLDLPTVLRRYAGKTPIVFTMHDMNLVTGGCHYDSDCRRFLFGCGNCPQLEVPHQTDASHFIHSAKRSVFGKLPSSAVVIVTPSRWLQQAVAHSPIFSRFPCLTIPNGIDTDIFCPHERPSTSKGSSNLIKLLFVASDLENPRKGLDLLGSALRLLDARGTCITLQTVGASTTKIDGFSSIRVENLGYVCNPCELSKIYADADALVVPSRQDNLPNTILESLACGTPTIAFASGGIPEMVRPGKTGWLASETTGAHLAEAIEAAIKDITAGRGLRQQCRLTALEEYGSSNQARAYAALFDDLRKAAN